MPFQLVTLSSGLKIDRKLSSLFWLRHSRLSYLRELRANIAHSRRDIEKQRPINCKDNWKNPQSLIEYLINVNILMIVRIVSRLFRIICLRECPLISQPANFCILFIRFSPNRSIVRLNSMSQLLLFINVIHGMVNINVDGLF